MSHRLRFNLALPSFLLLIFKRAKIKRVKEMGLRHSVLGFNQEEVLKLKKTITKEVRGEVKQVELKLDVTDLLIINHLADFPNRKKVTRIILEDKIFFWVSYNTIIEELPIIDIKKQALSDRLTKMVELGILERRIQTCSSSANMTFFRISEAYEFLKYKEGYSNQTQDVSYSTTIPCSSQTQDINNIVDNNIVDIEKEDTIVSKKSSIDYDFIKSEWERINPNLASIRGLNDKRKESIKSLLKKNNASVDDLIKAFEIISICSFCNGVNDRSWKATFDWVIADTKSCFNRLLEGYYVKGRYEKEQFDYLMSGNNLSLHTENSDIPKFQ